MMGFDSDQLVGELVGAKTAAMRFEALTRGLATIGLETVNYGVFGPNADDLVDKEIQFLTTMADDWMDYYYASNLSSSDPHVARLRAGKNTPYVWGESSFDHLEAPERETARQAAEAGLRSTLCVPLTGPSGGLAPVGAFNLGCALPEREFRMIIKEHGVDLMNIAHLFHAASIRQVWRYRAACEPLSARERDCLQYLAAGQRQEAIAQAMGLARITVEVHLRTARRKLAARTAAEAIAKALLYGEISHG